MKLRHYLWLLFLLILASCAEEDRNMLAVQAMIDDEVAKRVESYRQSRLKLCREQALTEASKLADSILLEEARMSRDTLDKPPKPEKPEKPELKTLLDSTPVKPFILPRRRDTIATDSNG
ncbi:MAG: hypothetical protein KDC66_14805 [Phaeodactylibacter sp.]|nr:hypothetical protein [Phaeodactylibacter sp.]MCB9272782.1 hypothetical protein [Lewinellaceae bacterium]